MTLSFEIVKHTFGDEVPTHLIPRTTTIYLFAFFTLLTSMLFLAITKLSTPNYLYFLSKGILRNRSIEKITKNDFPLSRLSSFLLLTNYLLSTSVLFYLLSSYYFPKNSFLANFVILIPLFFLFGPYLFLSFIEALTGDKSFSNEIKLTNWLICKLLGILYSVVLVFLFFTKDYQLFFKEITIVLLIVTYAYKLMRGFVFAISKRISLYYIILYFCTFEIIPLVAFFLLLKE